eukprot:NODE_248_length_1928_cov_268.591272_g198_i0.p1 GENE.NODE_248_length_1928_cov_268.591272_g198_i0~~NODE_248_length_1928_cov_268.591272_g198_i0.p1  ORF type:complete len:591 (+),score=99.84 NODE_248_length_1928_cov_268.591272_g198_i0:86-1858(+)
MSRPYPVRWCGLMLPILALFAFIYSFPLLAPPPSTEQLPSAELINHSLERCRTLDAAVVSAPFSLSSKSDVRRRELSDIRSAVQVQDISPTNSRQYDGFTLLALWKKCRSLPDAQCGDMNYLHTSWVILDHKGKVVVAREPPTPPKLPPKNPVFRRGMALKFVNATYVMGLLGSAWEPPFEPYHTFFWNIQTGAVTVYPVHSHHDIDYNPNTQTFLTLEIVNQARTRRPYATYDIVRHVDTTGKEVSPPWNGSALFDYISRYETQLRLAWRFCISNSGRQECKDKTHMNTVIWDWDHDVFYLNSRHLDTFYKVQFSTGRILWGVGRVGHMKLFENGQQVKKIVHHAHQLSMLGDNRFLLFDNGVNHSSYVVVHVNESHQTAVVEFRWLVAENTYQPAMGGVMRIPGGNYVGALGFGAYLVEFRNVRPTKATIYEITPDKREVSRISLRTSDKFDWLFYRAERFYTSPLIAAPHKVVCEGGSCPLLSIEVWNSFYCTHTTVGQLFLILPPSNRLLLAPTAIRFAPFWNPTPIDLALPSLPPGTHRLQLVVQNSDGQTGVHDLHSHSTHSSQHNNVSHNDVAFALSPLWPCL